MLLFSLYLLILILYILIVILIPGIGFFGILSKEPSSQTTLKITIIIPFRNEVNALDQLCNSINLITYPKENFEVIFIDDASNDDSISLLDKIDHSIDFQLIQNASHLGKKTSILNAIAEAKYDIILTTDADCELPSDLLSFVNGETDLSLGVALKTTDKWSVIENLQEVESLMLAATTIGSTRVGIPMLASGANLAYKKTVIDDTEPYQDNLAINSGDDMFLLKAAIEYNVKVGVRYGNPVTTKVEQTWSTYIRQATRWAGKNGRVGLLQASLSSWIVLATNVLLPLSLLTHFKSGWIILLIKFVVDFLFLFLSATYYNRYKAILFAPIVFFIYPVHLLRVGISILKERKKVTE